MKIAVGTENQAKLRAVEEVVRGHWPDASIVSCAAESKVSEQPLNNDEAIRGADNRALGALAAFSAADIGIGLEGTVDTNSAGMFLLGWVVVRHRDGRRGVGHSAGVQLPADVAQQVRDGFELGPLIQVLLRDADNHIRHTAGTNGVLTGGLYTRVDEFKDATKCALAPFLKPELY